MLDPSRIASEGVGLSDWAGRLGNLIDLPAIVGIGSLSVIVIWIVVFAWLWIWPTRWVLNLAHDSMPERGRGIVLGRLLWFLIPVKRATRRYSRRWVDAHLEQARRRFDAHYESVSRDHVAFVPGVIRRAGAVTVSLDDRSELTATPTSLRTLLKDREIPILISGEGGIGKTSLAVQMCRWAMDRADPLSSTGPMIPLFVQSSQLLEPTLLEYLLYQLRTLTGDETVEEWLMRELLADGRVLVVFDDVAERPASSVSAIYQAQKDLKIAAMIVTRRTDDPNLSPRSHVEVREFQADQVCSFIETYLQERAVCLPDGVRVSALARQFADLTDQHTSSAFFLKLFCDQLIDCDFVITRCDLLMLVQAYLKRVNRHRKPTDPTDEEVYRAYAAFACASVEANDFGNGSISRSDALTALGGNREHLEYLETRLRLIGADEHCVDHLQSTSSTLGLYVAAAGLAGRCSESREKWDELLMRMQRIPESSRGLAVAMHHVLTATSTAPSGIVEQVAQAAGLDIDLAKRRVADTGYLIRHELTRSGPDAPGTVPYRIYEVYQESDSTRRARAKRYEIRSASRSERSEMLRNAQRHAEVCQRLQDAPYIHRYRLAVEEQNGDTFWVIEDWIEGRSLLERKARDRDDHVRIMKRVAQGIRALHEREVYVRRLAPGAVLINSRNGDPVLTDFELAQIAGARSVAAGTRLSEQPYVAPERRLDPSLAGASREFRERADVYVWGALYAYLLTGREPDAVFIRNARELLRDAHVKEHTAELVLRCLSQSAKERPASMAEVIARI